VSLLRRIAELEAEGALAAVVTIVRVAGSTPREAGARMIVHADGRIEGTIGGGRIELEAIDAAKAAIASETSRFMDYALTQELGMCCGGQLSLFIEPIERAPRLVIFGAGHVGVALAKAASDAGFAVHVVDERPELLTKERFPAARGLYDDLEDPKIPFSDRTFVMVTTHDHALDQRLVERALKKPNRWLGLIGSRRKAELTKKRLDQKGFSEREIASVRCPVGLAIAAETPAEIAVSILGELIAVRRGATLGDAQLESKKRPSRRAEEEEA
jgi:xanthine dehydrogenase accessory factor